MSDIRCPKCFREGATWAHVENCEGVQSAIDALKSAPCNICGEVGHLADECPIMSKRIQDIAAKMNFPSSQISIYNFNNPMWKKEPSYESIKDEVRAY